MAWRAQASVLQWEVLSTGHSTTSEWVVFLLHVEFQPELCSVRNAGWKRLEYLLPFTDLERYIYCAKVLLVVQCKELYTDCTHIVATDCL